MFFSISTEKFDDRFVNHHPLGNYYVSVDNGWQHIDVGSTTVYFKGYADDAPLATLAADFATDPSPKYTGNFCMIIANADSLVISHSVDRSFPLAYKDKFITNFVDTEIKDSLTPIWSNQTATLTKSGIRVHNNAVNILPNFDLEIPTNIVVDRIELLLREKLKFFDHNTLPIKSFLSGGVDTMMVYALSLESSVPELIVNEHFDLTEFMLKNYQRINHSFWGYKQIHHWKSPAIILSGAPGDEVFMRGPTTAALWCAWNNYNVLDMLNGIDYCYHKKYFLKPSNQAVFLEHWNRRKEIQEYSYNELCEKICNNVANDHQHWHLENTLTWTPLKDVRILQHVLTLSREALLDHILKGSLDRMVIGRFNPTLNNYICTHKNYNQYHNLEKYPEYMEKIRTC